MGSMDFALAARDASRFSPLFILAPARSYSSVISTMIGQHPQCASLPELKLFAYPTIGELEASLPRYWSDRGITHRSPGLVRAIAQFELGNQSPAALGSALSWLSERRHWSGSQIFDVLLERISPRIAVEKSPENVGADDALARLAAFYPAARYLHLTRHPVMTQRSMQEHIRRTVPGFVLPGQPMSGIAAWVETHCRILKFAATLPKSRYLCAKAEDILDRPRDQLRLIAEWLALSTTNDAIEAMLHPERSPFATPGPASTGIVGGLDPGFLNDPVPRSVNAPPKMAMPQEWADNSSLWLMTVDMANRLGYQ